MRSIICACVAATLAAAATLVHADARFGVPGVDGAGNAAVAVPDVVQDREPGPLPGLDPLSAVRSLYLSAAYEDALAALASLPPAADADQADKFRALCLLALSRTDDAKRVLTRLATRRPMLQLDDAESPKLREMFRVARAQVLPAALKALYTAAKSSFEQGELKKALADFSDVIQLSSEEELASDPTASDIKLLAEGFARLANEQLAAPAQPAAPADPDASDREDPAEPGSLSDTLTAGSAPGTTEPLASTVAEAPAFPSDAGAPLVPIYSADDGDVVAPVVIDQTIPRWSPPTIGDYRFLISSGVLEVIIDETGAVTSVSLPQRVNVMYDQLLINAARHWRYRPALVNGQPVKYRKRINIVLRPAEQRPDQEPRKN